MASWLVTLKVVMGFLMIKGTLREFIVLSYLT